MKRCLWVSLAAVFVLTACSLFKPNTELIEYPKPDLKANFQYFVDQKILYNLEVVPEVLRGVDRSNVFVGRTDDLLGGLNPDLPIILFSMYSFDHEIELPAVYTKSCMVANYISYLIQDGADVILIDSVPGMARIFAPIESAEEALSYGLAVTGYHALYDLEGHPDYKILTQPLEESHVEETSDGYIVHLFDTDMCGCGPHITPAVDILVRPDGTVTEVARYDAFRDPELDQVCFD